MADGLSVEALPSPSPTPVDPGSGSVPALPPTAPSTPVAPPSPPILPPPGFPLPPEVNAGEAWTATSFFVLLFLFAGGIFLLHERRRRRQRSRADAEYLLHGAVGGQVMSEQEREEEAVRSYAPHQDF